MQGAAVQCSRSLPGPCVGPFLPSELTKPTRPAGEVCTLPRKSINPAHGGSSFFICHPYWLRENRGV